MSEFDKIKNLLEENCEYKTLLFKQGFCITNRVLDHLDSFPFYGNWTVTKIADYLFYLKDDVKLYWDKNDQEYLFLIGHAYNPIDGEVEEEQIIRNMIHLQKNDFWEYESQLTGVYVMGKILSDGTLIHWTDCAGMRITYYGKVNGNYYITSHVNLVASIEDLHESKYIKSLKNNRLFHLFGNVLPADLSIYEELKRSVPNHYYKNGKATRFFPLQKIIECKNEDEYNNIVEESSTILKRSLARCAEKWNAAISVTGGKDSGETLASAKGNYDKFQYFSYISKPEESVDAYAAKLICEELGLAHKIIEIPNDNEKIDDFDIINEIIYINGGSIGYIRTNEVRKRSFFIKNRFFDVEIKSWVNEIVRAYWYKKYHTKQFPKKPNGRLLASLYKVFLGNRILFLKTSKVFKEYINTYINQSDIELVGDWTTLWSWEFGFSAGEGQSLFAEHILSYDISIPFNNRYLISIMLKAKLEDRINDRLQKDIIKTNNQQQFDLNINVVNAAHTSLRAHLEKMYLVINSHLPF